MIYFILGVSVFNSLLIIILLIKLKKQDSRLVLQKLEENERNMAQIFQRIQTYDHSLNRFEIIIKEEFKQNRSELNTTFTNFTNILGQKQDALAKQTYQMSENVRAAVEKKLSEIQQDNGLKLEQMRQTVDEKLHQTLERRLGQSFKLVSDKLEMVQKGLGEMQSLATGVGDLKKVLSNVKTKGVLGEYQLGSILDQILIPSQYKQNVKTKKGSNCLVEFAIKIPAKNEKQEDVLLPLDAKFPTQDYERLINAYDLGNSLEIEKNQKELERKIKSFAKDIRDKYIDPPQTTDFAIMFLPFEGLYAEVLRIPGLLESVQRDFKIIITGPTTISAFLSSLQVGFRSLAVEKRTSEVWDLLSSVKTEFGKFGKVLSKTKDKLDLASKEIGQAEVRSRAIERKLSDVQSLPQGQTAKLIHDAEF